MRFSPRNLSLRGKLILCLLATSMLSCIVVGGFAYWQLMQKFDDMVRQESARRFSADVSDYFRVYGNWETGIRREDFHAFAERRARLLGRLPRSSTLSDPTSGTERTPAFPDLTPDTLHMAPLPADVPVSVPRPPQTGDGHPVPPFRFYLFDAQFRSLIKLAPYEIGDIVRSSDRDKLVPIESGGRIVAHYVPDGSPNYSERDRSYLVAMRDALILGSGVGIGVTLLLGFVLGSRLGRALKKLTRAVRAMGVGDLHQKVDVASNDEIGVLSRTFNRMSAELAKKYEELKQSHARIEKMAAQLRELSIRDALTQLHNRRYFDEHCMRLFDHAVRYQRPFSVSLADIDHFKQINDTYSHAVGDEVLRRIGEILSSKVRSVDLVARYGGEEFVIAFPETDSHGAVDSCESLRQRIESHPWHEVHPDLRVTVSIGVCSDATLKDFRAMLKIADELLYRAKHEGRNRVCTQVD
ncbi:MAG TPA: diguanylate cyclase [Rhodocyclaceae bacterium]|nr:diguanylate cyclase [Rhodocyclaceae bacterium]